MRYGRFLATAAFALISVQPVRGSEIGEQEEIAKSSGRLETTRAMPKAYGTKDYTVTVVPAIAFLPEAEGQGYATSGSLGRFGPTNVIENFFAPLDIPPGAVIDFIGLNSQTDTPAGLGVAVIRRSSGGITITVGALDSSVHPWGTDYNAAPIGFHVSAPTSATLIHVQQGALPTNQFLGHVEVWWRREVSFPIGPTFTDVTPDHPYYKFIEAVAASGITVGCGGGNFCPARNITRGEMAVFLGKALGLHFGTLGPP